MKAAVFVCLSLSALSSSALEKGTTSARGPERQSAHQPGAGGYRHSDCGRRTQELWELLPAKTSRQHGS